METGHLPPFSPTSIFGWQLPQGGQWDYREAPQVCCVHASPRYRHHDPHEAPTRVTGWQAESVSLSSTSGKGNPFPPRVGREHPRYSTPAREGWVIKQWLLSFDDDLALLPNNVESEHPAMLMHLSSSKEPPISGQCQATAFQGVMGNGSLPTVCAMVLFGHLQGFAVRTIVCSLHTGRFIWKQSLHFLYVLALKCPPTSTSFPLPASSSLKP